MISLITINSPLSIFLTIIRQFDRNGKLLDVRSFVSNNVAKIITTKNNIEIIIDGNNKYNIPIVGLIAKGLFVLLNGGIAEQDIYGYIKPTTLTITRLKNKWVMYRNPVTGFSNPCEAKFNGGWIAIVVGSIVFLALGVANAYNRKSFDNYDQNKIDEYKKNMNKLGFTFSFVDSVFIKIDGTFIIKLYYNFKNGELTAIEAGFNNNVLQVYNKGTFDFDQLKSEYQIPNNLRDVKNTQRQFRKNAIIFGMILSVTDILIGGAFVIDSAYTCNQ